MERIAVAPSQEPHHEPPAPVIALDARRLSRGLAGLALALGLLSLAGLLVVHFLAEPLGLALGERGDPDSLHSLLYVLNPADRLSIGSWALAGVFLLAGGLLAAPHGPAYRGQWLGLAALAGGLSLLEVTALDARLADPLAALGAGAPYGWWSVAAVLAAALIPLYLRFARDLPRAVRWPLGPGLILAVGGGALTAVPVVDALPADLLAWAGGMLRLGGAILLVRAALARLAAPALSGARPRQAVASSARSGWVILALLLAFAIQLDAAGTRYMHPDEMHSFEATDGTLATTVAAIATDVHGPAYFLAFNAWRQIAGTGEYPARLLSALLSVLTLAVTYRLGRNWLAGPRAGVLALLALGVSAYFYRYSVEIRPYPLLMLAAAGSMLLYGRWLARPTWHRAVQYSLSVALIMYTHYLGAFLILAQVVYWLATEGRRLTRRRVAEAALAWGGALVLWLPWLSVFLGQIRHEGTLVADTLLPGVGKAGSALPTSIATLQAFVALGTNGLPLVVGLLLVAGLWRAWRRAAPSTGTRTGLIALWALGVPLLVFATNLVVPLYEPRYIAYAAVGMALLLAACVLMLPARMRPATGIVLLVLGLLTVRSGVRPQDPLRDTLRALDAAFQPGDAVLLANQRVDHFLAGQYEWYAPSTTDALYVAGGGAVAYPPVQMWEGDLADLPRCVWFGTNDWFDDAVRARFDALERERALLVTIGEHTQTFFQRLCTPPEGPGQVFGAAEGDALRFLGADITAQTRDALTLALWWAVDAAPAADYTIGAYLLDASGALAAQKDGPLTDYWDGSTIPTSALEPGRVTIDRRTIALPPDLPSGEYTLALAVYRPADGARLPLADAPDSLLRALAITLPR